MYSCPSIIYPVQYGLVVNRYAADAHHLASIHREPISQNVRFIFVSIHAVSSAEGTSSAHTGNGQKNGAYRVLSSCVTVLDLS